MLLGKVNSKQVTSWELLSLCSPCTYGNQGEIDDSIIWYTVMEQSSCVKHLALKGFLCCFFFILFVITIVKLRIIEYPETYELLSWPARNEALAELFVVRSKTLSFFQPEI